MKAILAGLAQFVPTINKNFSYLTEFIIVINVRFLWIVILMPVEVSGSRVWIELTSEITKVNQIWGTLRTPNRASELIP